MSRKTDFIKKYKEIMDKWKAISEKEQKDRTYKEECFYNDYLKLNANVKSSLSDIVFNDSDSLETILNFAISQNFTDKDINYWKFSIYKNNYKQFFNNDEASQIFEDKKITDNERVEKFEIYLNKNPGKNKDELDNKLLQSMKKLIFRDLQLDSYEKIENLLNELERKNGPDNCVPDESCLMSETDLVISEEEHPLHSEIEELKISASEEDKAILDLADEIYTYAGKDNMSWAVGQVEELGRYYDRKNHRDFVDYLNGSEFGIEKFQDDHNSGKFVLDTYEDKVDFFNKANNFNFKVDDNTVEKITDIIKDIDKLDMFYDPNIKYDKDSLKTAILSKDISKVKEATNKYNARINGIKSVLDKISKLGDDGFVGNDSYSRVGYVPLFMRLDIRGATTMRMFSFFNGVSKSLNKPVEFFIKNPVEGIKECIKYYQKNGETLNLFKNDLVNGLKHSHGENRFKNHEQIIDANFPKYMSEAYYTLAYMLPKEKRKELLNISHIFLNESLYFIPTYKEIDKHAIPENLIYLEPEDINISNISDEKIIDVDTLKESTYTFDVDNYIRDGKTTPSAIAARIATVARADISGPSKDRILEDLEKCSNHLIRNYSNDLDKTTKNMLNKISNGNLNIAKDKKIDFFLKKQEVLSAIKKGTIKEEPTKYVQILKDMEADYNGRSGFWKVFGSETRELNSVNKSIREALQNSLGDDFNRYYTGNYNEISQEELYKYETGEKEYSEEPLEIDDLEFEDSKEIENEKVKEENDLVIVNELE